MTHDSEKRGPRDPVVYRSRDPEVVGAIKSARERINAYVTATQEVLAGEGFGEYKVWRHGGGWSPGRFHGLAIPQDEWPPKGWRMAGTDGRAVPDKRTAAGKAVAKRLDAIKHPGDPRRALIGMPADVLTYGGNFTTPGLRLLEDGSAVYLTWRVDPAEYRESFSSESTDIDPARWERVRLSEYYAAVEQADAAEKAIAS